MLELMRLLWDAAGLFWLIFNIGTAIAAWRGVTRAQRYWLSKDQTANVLTGGYEDESISARAGRISLEPDAPARWLLARRVINAIFRWQADHCVEAFASEQRRRGLPAAYQRPPAVAVPVSYE